MWILELFFLTTVATAAPSVAPAPALEHSVNVFIDEMAAKHGFDRGELERVFGRIRSSAKIVELMDRQAKRKPWQDYRALFVNREKITHGFRFWRNNAAKLAEARAKYGVPEEVIIAVIGIETHYGKNTGRFRVLEALTTLAFDYPKRSKMFRLELEHYLLLAREETMALATPRGSYAGAMGIAQFMPGRLSALRDRLRRRRQAGLVRERFGRDRKRGELLDGAWLATRRAGRGSRQCRKVGGNFIRSLEAVDARSPR